MRAIIAGGGIGGLTAAMALHAEGIDVQVYESVVELAPLGVGINVLPHAMAHLQRLGLLDIVLPLGVQTEELCFFTKRGQLIWREPRGLAAGYPIPQLSVHRGHLHMALFAEARRRLGADVVRHAHAVRSFSQDESGRVTVELIDRATDRIVTDSADVLVAADGIHSAIRQQLYPDQGPPSWQGDILWRSTSRWKPFLTGRSMVMAGHLPHKFVAYPLSEVGDDGLQLINWVAELDRTAFGMLNREDWNRRGNFDDFMPHFEDWVFDWLDIPSMFRATDSVFEFPMIDRDPLDRWTFGRVTLLGDAAHPMYPIGSNGAAQAIIDGLALADSLGDSIAEGRSIESGLAQYEDLRRPRTSQIVLSNRQHGPERVLDIAEQRAPEGFANIGEVFAPGELEAISAQYKQVAGFDLQSILNPARQRRA